MDPDAILSDLDPESQLNMDLVGSYLDIFVSIGYKICCQIGSKFINICKYKTVKKNFAILNK